ncbi:putative mitochondrial exoribonuclease Cyt-4 [Talaromyces proteolyticus]|uniref:Mitochondrial exoribonuclease Cyt-4 n=1 Tax=Talaromyces proteolyticus TaxID=1131652 RepID=A0AAD4PT13_9EURO|nr:putative mitochondrial exoribonuclease Cyt-4 [Talaromyces proteolyticus]KAH8692366.1 putative mitochondrial exoribonuclease Cyt-4 [Talaromyces proteolyticus]
MQAYVCARCARLQSGSVSSIANPLLRSQIRNSRNIEINRYAKRALHEERNSKPEPPSDYRTAIDNLLLKTEFETNKDIREYLRKWQTQNINHMDPVRGPGTSNPGSPKSWMGNMLNDSITAYDEAVERASMAVDEGSDFKTDLGDAYEVGELLEPGDLVGFFSGVGLMVPAIYIRSVERQKQFYTLRGKWRVSRDQDVDLVVKNFVSKELTDTLLPFLPDTIAKTDVEMQALTEGGVPRSVGEPLISLLQEFDSQVNAIYRENCKALDYFHSIVADPEVRRTNRLRELACKALNIEEGKVSPAALFATHRAALRTPYLILRDRSSMFADNYVIQPKSMANDFETVVEWVRDHEDYVTQLALGERPDFQQHPLQKFIDKAQRLIRQSRQFRSPTTMANVGPSSQRLNPEETSDGRLYNKIETEGFTEDDKKILQYLQYYSFPAIRITNGLSRYGAVHIMRATGMYATVDIQRGAIPLLLQELGVFSPWENIYTIAHSLALPNHRVDMNKDFEKGNESETGTILDQYKKDAMENSRVDWGNLPIYCIDDPGAKEIDDGISFERVPGSRDTFWVRVHVANPSAFVPTDDSVSEYAAKCLSTVYLPERVYPMIPPRITHGRFSLAPDRPTLTISAKVNLEGDVLETNIVNGYARNVIYLTHGRLRRVFGAEEQPKILAVGGEIPPREVDHYQEILTKDEEDHFHILRHIMTNINDKWRENGGLTWPDSFDKNPTVYTGHQPAEPYEMSEVTHGGYYLGDPIIGLQYNESDPYEIPDIGKKNLVALVMRFACHVAGRWGADRNIPMIYDGTYYHPEYPPLTPEKLNNLNSDDWLHYAFPKGISSSTPIPHHGLGVEVYTKTTSPLRRYTDLLAHYQIEAALRYEKEYGEKFDGNKTPSLLPFSTQDVDLVIERIKTASPAIKSIQKQSNTVWACQFLFRAFYFGECELPATLPCIVRQNLEGVSTLGTRYVGAYAGENLPFGVRARLFVPPEFQDLELLSTVEAKIIAVDMSLHVVDMEVVQKVKKWERTGDWA